ncbi:PH domain-containing protein [Demequina sp. SYSU T00192]|uniref:PH domain-containing protein n=1 Tax=Demequina litoralis TaxID=3051660 RepID=A0ABT8G8J4_9MICO|nr:PH domain-containing protein [Demequina sp. SYSU T00192]MDN4475460.1 PH domain-containing protein [Demequina sp. SYSU T00192]
MNDTTGYVYHAPREWTRLHPVSPLLGGWVFLGLILAYWIHNQLPAWVDGGDDNSLAFFDQFPFLWLVLAALLAFAATIGISFWQWRRTEYRIGDDAVYLRQGIVTRQQRQARLDRLQAVDVVQPLLARLFGFAAINVQVAGGQKSGVELKFLRLGDAEALRNEILALAAGVKEEKATGDDAAGTTAPTAAPDATTADTTASSGIRGHLAARAGALSNPEAVLSGTERVRTAVAAAEEREVYTLPLKRLLLSIVLSGATFFLLTLPFVGLIAFFVFRVDVVAAVGAAIGTSLVAIVTALAGLLGFFWTRLNGGFGFTAGISADGLRLRHGLTETRRQTVPPGRVQAIRLYQPFLWRGQDWWRITINVAGYGEDQESVSVLHPVATREEAIRAVWLVLPDLGDPDPYGTLGHALHGHGADGGFTASPEAARRVDPLQWRFRGVRATDRALLIRRGRWERELFVVPHERTQSLGLTQGPIRRALGLANVVVHSTQGPVTPVAAHLAVDDAIELLDAQAARAREGRRRQTPEQWMSAVGLETGASDE